MSTRNRSIEDICRHPDQSDGGEAALLSSLYYYFI